MATGSDRPPLMTFETQARTDIDHFYANRPNDASLTLNLQFYSNAVASEPEGDFIDTIHTTWSFEKLEAASYERPVHAKSIFFEFTTQGYETRV